MIIQIAEDVATGEFATHSVEESSNRKRKLEQNVPVTPSPAPGKCALVALLEARCKLKGLPMPGPGHPFSPEMYLSDDDVDLKSDDGIVVVNDKENEKPLLLPAPSPKTEVRVVRPFVRTLKVKAGSDVNALLSQIIQNQEKHNSRLSPYEDAISIFNKDFATTLDDIQVMHFIGLLSDNPSYVNQFLTFNSVQRGMFLTSKLAQM